MMLSSRSAAAERVAIPMSYVPPSPAQQITWPDSSFRSRMQASPEATAAAEANVVHTVGTP
jgi:hypothetical protein